MWILEFIKNNQRQEMNENEMLNDKPIFVAKSRIFHGLILVATGLMIALVSYFFAQEPKANKLKQVASWLVWRWVFGCRRSYFSLYNAYI